MSNVFGGSYRLNADGSCELVEEPTFDPHHSRPMSERSTVAPAVDSAADPQPALAPRWPSFLVDPETPAPEAPATAQE